jgi:plasmid stabilization system protein ParE
MAKKIVWTKTALGKFNNIVDYLESEWGNRVTENFVTKTYDILELISDHSDLGTLEHPEKKIRAFLLTKHNRLFYRVTEKEIILLNFFETRSGRKRRNSKS